MITSFPFSDSITGNSVLDVRRRLTTGLSVTVSEGYSVVISSSSKSLSGSTSPSGQSWSECLLNSWPTSFPAELQLLFKCRGQPHDPLFSSFVLCRSCSGGALTALPDMTTNYFIVSLPGRFLNLTIEHAVVCLLHLGPYLVSIRPPNHGMVALSGPILGAWS